MLSTWIENMAPSVRTHVTIDTKYKAILQVEKGVQKKLVAEQFGVPTSTLSGASTCGPVNSGPQRKRKIKLLPE